MNHSRPVNPDSSPPLHVVAGALIDARGRILLARREGRRELAGLWEFPGGKVEPGESASEALVRELREEIGIEVEPSDCSSLIAVPHRMTCGKRIVLDVHRIVRFRGRARGMESQAIAWVRPERLSDYSMPGADRPVVAALCEPEACLVTGPGDALDEGLLARLEAALAAGMRRVALGHGGALTSARAEALAALAQRHGATIHLDRAAFESAAMTAAGFGLHLRPQDLDDAGSAAPCAGIPLSAACADAAQLARAQALGAGFAVLASGGACGAASLLEHFAILREAVTLPMYAADAAADLPALRACGAQGIALTPADWPGR